MNESLCRCGHYHRDDLCFDCSCDVFMPSYDGFVAAYTPGDRAPVPAE